MTGDLHGSSGRRAVSDRVPLGATGSVPCQAAWGPKAYSPEGTRRRQASRALVSRPPPPVEHKIGQFVLYVEVAVWLVADS